MRLHVKLKEFLSMFFMAILFFPAFNASLFFTGVKPLYSIIKCSTEIFYDWR
ncbi:TPA: protein YkfM, partial [Escherichia coli]